MTPSPQTARRLGAAIVLGAGIVVLALSLRAGIGSLSVVLPTVRDELDFSPTGISVLTTLPPLCFALVGLGTGRLVLRYGVHRVTVVLLAALALGLLARAAVDSWLVFLLATVLAMGGAAVGNVVLPPLTKQHFPHRVALVSSLYGAAVVGGATLASSLTVPIGDASGGWRVGLGAWAAVAVLGLLLWLPTAFAHERPAAPEPGVHRTTMRDVARTRLGIAFVLCFAAQSSQAYVQFGWWGAILTDAGAEPAHAGVLLGVITGVQIPVTLALPTLIRLTHGGIALPVLFAVCTVAGWVGLLAAPLAVGGVLWALLLGAGGGAFTWILAMVGLRSRTQDVTAQLSSVTQGVGYLAASVATFAAGVLREATGGWEASLVMVTVLAVLIGVSGAVVARGHAVEDELPAVA